MRLAGQHLMEGLVKGVEERRNEVARAVAGYVAAPSFTVPGVSPRARGGDGASAALPRGPITVNVTINGQGREAGEEAAEALLLALSNAQD